MFPGPLPYPAIRKTIEYMDIESRARLTAAVPELLKLERSMPLRMRNLAVSPIRFNFDRIIYVMDVEQRPIPPDVATEGDLVIDHRHFPFPLARNVPTIYPIKMTKHSEFEPKREEVVHSNLATIKKDLMNRYLGGRSVVTVKTFSVDHQSGIIQWPVGLKIDCKELHVSFSGAAAIETIRPILVSTPQKIKFFARNGLDASFDNEIVQNSDYVCVKTFDNLFPTPRFIDGLLKLKNRHLHFRSMHFSHQDIFDLIFRWLEDNREIGTKFTYDFDSRNFLREVQEMVLRDFNLPRSKLKIEKPDGTLYRHAVAIPMGSTKEIVLYGSKPKRSVWNSRCFCCLKVMAAGTTIRADRI